MILKTSQKEDIYPFLEKLRIPDADSHKGQNGKALIIGGSKLFHAASLWAAEVASHFLDMVHYSSTEENNEVFIHLKTIFRNGIIVHKKEIPTYVEEDDVILIGPGMVRGSITNYELLITNFQEIIELEDEAAYSRQLTYYLLKNFPQKQFVLDAGALQMMDADWLKSLEKPAVITPHIGEFAHLFGEDISEIPVDEKASRVTQLAKEYNCVILLKAIQDIVSNGKETFIIEGGNQGLTKGGSGDVLAGLTTALCTMSDPLSAAILSSYIEKKAADELKNETSQWFTITELIDTIPRVMSKLLLKSDTM